MLWISALMCSALQPKARQAVVTLEKFVCTCSGFEYLKYLFIPT